MASDLAEYGLEGDAYVELVCMYSLLVGVASIALGVFKLGALAKAIPKPVGIPKRTSFQMAWIIDFSFLTFVSGLQFAEWLYLKVSE